jgi:hypothetical protein
MYPINIDNPSSRKKNLGAGTNLALIFLMGFLVDCKAILWLFGAARKTVVFLVT